MVSIFTLKKWGPFALFSSIGSYPIHVSGLRDDDTIHDGLGSDVTGLKFQI